MQLNQINLYKKRFSFDSKLKMSLKPRNLNMMSSRSYEILTLNHKISIDYYYRITSEIE